MEKYNIGKVFRYESFGNIHKATTVIENNSVLIKMIPIKKENHHQIAIQKEIEALIKLNHPNIAKYYEYFQENDYLYVVMEFSEGKTFKQIISEQENNYFKESFILKVFLQMVNGLKYIHERNIHHQCMSSENILLLTNGTTKITNFKITRVLGEESISASPFPEINNYQSPEIIQGKNSSSASDIWSLGVIIYELMMLKQPFFDENLKKWEKRFVMNNQIIQQIIQVS
jgi:serine/threonine protein kinase